MDDRTFAYNESLERWEAAQDAIAERVKYYLNNEDDYNECLFENFLDDICNVSVEQSNDIEDYLRTRDFEKLGRYLWSVSYENRMKLAEKQALEDFENGEFNDE